MTPKQIERERAAFDHRRCRATIARLRAELRRKDKALRYIHDNTECLLSHETARGALKKPQ